MTSSSDSLLVRLFGVALIAHVVGNWHQADVPALLGIAELVVGVLGVMLMILPSRPLLLTSAVASITSLVGEIPKTGNHWLLVGLASLIIVGTRGRGPSMYAGLRWLLVVFYAFASFAKLNSGFLDPSTSCAVFYANQTLGSWSLSTLDPSSAGAQISIWSTVVIEMSVVPLLVWRRTRWLGLVIGSLFHGVISLDLDQHFYDFTAVLCFLFASFMPIRPSEEETGQTWSVAKWVVAPTALLLVGLSVLPQSGLSARILSMAPFALWIPFLVAWIRFVWMTRAAAQISWRVSPIVAVVVALAFLNGITPYTELKTAFSFNMYSNLLTAQGFSNHLLIRRTYPLRDGYERPVEIVESSDPGLEVYRERGYLIAFPQFQRYLVGRAISVVFRRNGQLTTVEDTSNTRGLVSTGPWWWWAMPLRSLDKHWPPRCQDVFLPAL